MRGSILLTLLGFSVTLSLLSPSALTQEQAQAAFDFDRTISIVYIIDDRYVVTGRPREYYARNQMTLIFEAIYPYLYQLEKTNQYFRPDVDNMLVDYELRLITPSQSKTYYLGSRWLATDFKVVPIVLEDYIQIQDTLSVRPTPQPHDGPVSIEEAVDRWTRDVHERNSDRLAQPFPEYAGWSAERRRERLEAIAMLDNSELYFVNDVSPGSSHNQPQANGSQSNGRPAETVNEDGGIAMSDTSTQAEIADDVDGNKAEPKASELIGSKAIAEPSSETSNSVSTENNDKILSPESNRKVLIAGTVALFGLLITGLYLYGKHSKS